MEVRRGRAREWTLLRQLAGNVLPFAHWVPTFLLAWLLLTISGGSAVMTVAVLVGVGLSLSLGTWALFDRYGLFHNAVMRRALRPRLSSSLGENPPAGRCWFVGLATQSHFGWLDTDEDVGYLALYPDRLAYVGDRYSLSVPRTQVLGVERRPVPFYSLMGYSWTVIRFEDAEGDQPLSVRLLSREVDRVLSQQREANTALWEAVQGWYQETGASMMLPRGHESYEHARAAAVEELSDWLDPVTPETREDIAQALEQLRHEIPLDPRPSGAPRPSEAPQALARSIRSLAEDGADWQRIENEIRAFVRCFQDAAIVRENHELLLGAYVAVRGRSGEQGGAVESLPPDDVLAADEELARDYEAIFADVDPGGDPGGSWRALRRSRRLQALFARRALRRLAEKGATGPAPPPGSDPHDAE